MQDVGGEGQPAGVYWEAAMGPELWRPQRQSDLRLLVVLGSLETPRRSRYSASLSPRPQNPLGHFQSRHLLVQPTKESGLLAWFSLSF